MNRFLITRRIEIDAGHRIMTHGSKCRHLHGHRYVIEAVCSARQGRLHGAGEQAAMVLDFGFLKEEMVRVIDECCDHGFIAALQDRDLLTMFAPLDVEFEPWYAEVSQKVAEQGFFLTSHTRLGTRLYVMAGIPTAEMLSRHWYERLAPAVARRSDGVAALEKVVVWETPNCSAEYVAQ